MSILEIKTSKAPLAIGPYSQAIQAGGMIYTSGQIPLDPTTGKVVAGDITVQATQALINLQSVLSSAGVTLSAVVKTTVFMKDMNDFASCNDVYGSFFSQPYPARSCVEVSRLPKDVLIEIEAIAAVQ